jgi:hypothetical protein
VRSHSACIVRSTASAGIVTRQLEAATWLGFGLGVGVGVGVGVGIGVG